MGEETTIMGTVLSVVFQNEENGYAVPVSYTHLTLPTKLEV